LEKKIVAERDTGVKARLNIAARAEAMPLSKFLDDVKKRRGLTRQERLRILDQIILLLEMNYVHLPLKRAMHAINPIQQLKLLKYRLETKRKMEDELEFHHRLVEIFATLRDIHTRYLLPSPFRLYTAFLPFLIEQYFEEEEDRYLLTRIDRNHFKPVRKSDVNFFKPGVEILFWNGIPIRRAIEMNGAQQAGSNTDARFARGLDSLTIRPLRASLPPNEEWVEITYKDLRGKTRNTRHDWLVYQAHTKPSSTKTSKKKRAAVDVLKSKINQVKRELFAPLDVPIHKGFEYIFYSQLRKVPFERLGSKKPGFKQIGYIRLFSFEVDDQAAFVNEVKKIVTAPDFPQDGLIIDVRGNGGGRVRAGERLLQLFTPRRVKPELFEFINTPLNLEICKIAPSDLGLAQWVDSIEESVVTGATYSMGFPLTSEESCNDIGQVYYGPVILVTDALSYSTTDMFAAGFQDNHVGKILGTSNNTGAGGANVWNYKDFIKNTRTSPRQPFKPLPRDTDLNVAIRRSIRVGRNEGRPLEELGINPDRPHRMTRRDLMDHNQDLIEEAARSLKSEPVYSLTAEIIDSKPPRISIAATSITRRADARKKIVRVDVSVNGAPYKSLDADNGVLPTSAVELGNLQMPIKLTVQAFDLDNGLVASLRRTINSQGNSTAAPQ
jgi:C-terminal processing protease CtpA/Prc